MALHLALNEDAVFQVKTAKHCLQTLVDLTAPRCKPDEPEPITIEATALWVTLNQINDLLQEFTTHADAAPVVRELNVQ